QQQTSGSATFTINVVDANLAGGMQVSPPSPQMASPGVGQPFSLGSIVQGNGIGPFGVGIDWGDGSNDDLMSLTTPGPLPALNHLVVANGSDLVTVTVVDLGYQTSTNASFPVTVAAAVPSVRVTPPVAQAANVNQIQAFAVGRFTETDASGPFAVTVDWGDGT